MDGPSRRPTDSSRSEGTPSPGEVPSGGARALWLLWGFSKVTRCKSGTDIRHHPANGYAPPPPKSRQLNSPQSAQLPRPKNPIKPTSTPTNTAKKSPANQAANLRPAQTPPASNPAQTAPGTYANGPRHSVAPWPDATRRTTGAPHPRGCRTADTPQSPPSVAPDQTDPAPPAARLANQPAAQTTPRHNANAEFPLQPAPHQYAHCPPAWPCA